MVILCRVFLLIIIIIIFKVVKCPHLEIHQIHHDHCHIGIQIIVKMIFFICNIFFITITLSFIYNLITIIIIMMIMKIMMMILMKMMIMMATLVRQ